MRPQNTKSASKLMRKRSTGISAIESSVGSFGTDPDRFVLYVSFRGNCDCKILVSIVVIL